LWFQANRCSNKTTHLLPIEVFNSYCSVCQANIEVAHLSTVDNGPGLNRAANSPTGGVDTDKHELVQVYTLLRV